MSTRWWFVVQDSDPKRPLEQKIALAAVKFKRKFNAYPTVCLVLPRAIKDLKKVGLILVEPKPNALTDHLWLGVLNEPRPRK